MHIHATPEGLSIQTPAKLNLFFEILTKRSDGYHEIETLMCPISLFDTLQFQEDTEGQLTLTCRWACSAKDATGSGFDQISEGPDNLVIRAVELVRRRAGVRQGARLRLIKRIPAAAGLGGGSSDAAAAMVAANEGWRLGISRKELMDWAAELGSDIPFFLAGGPAVCRGRGERILPTEQFSPLDFVVVRPPEGLSTAAVYGACRPADRPYVVEPLIEALQQGDWKQTGRRLWNRLQPAAEGLSPWIKRLKEAFSQEDFLGFGMSGSGTAFYGICRHARHARRCARRLKTRELGVVFAVRSCHY